VEWTPDKKRTNPRECIEAQLHLRFDMGNAFNSFKVPPVNGTNFNVSFVMKSIIPIIAFALSLTITEAAELRTEKSYRIKERGAHHRLWETVELVDAPGGGKTERIRSYMEIATGMHYRGKGGEWLESAEEIEILPNGAGAAASQGSHKVLFPPDINEGQIELNLADGKWLRSRVMGIAYFDLESGKNVLIAETTNSIGSVVGSNVVVYADAIVGDCRADIRYTYRRSGFEQDVIIRTAPPEPSEYGLNPETTVIQILTEFFSPPEPKKERKTWARMDAPGNEEADEYLNFGELTFGLGRAFQVGEERSVGKGTRVRKQWLKLENRDWLFEEVPFGEADQSLRRLPKQHAARSNGPRSLRTASLHRVLPAPRLASVDPRKNFQIAQSAIPQEPGFVMDYVAMSSISNFTFKADTTYYVNGLVNLKGTVVLEGNTVIKYNPTAGGWIYVDNTTIDCQTSEYRPAVFTSMHDNTVGETISGSSGNPNAAADLSYYLYTANEPQDLKHIRMLYSYCGLTINYGNATVRNIQFNHCQYPVYTVGGAAVKLQNVLMHDISEVGIWTWIGNVDVQNATVHRCRQLLENEANANFIFTNSLFVLVTNWGASFNGAFNATNTTGVGVFQPIAGGKHYLASASSFRNAGTTNIDSGLLQELRSKTTYPPISYTNVSFTTPQTFSPQAQRDTDIPDLGYHYDPLDYAFGGCETSANLTFAAGTASGCFRTTSGWYHAGHSIRMIGNIAVSFEGTITSPTYWVRLNTVQEEDRTAGYGHGTIENWEEPLVPTVRGVFLRCSAMANEIFNGYFAGDYGRLRCEMTHSEFWSGALGNYSDYVNTTNCLMRRTYLGVWNGHTSSSRYMRNCSVIGGTLELIRGYGGPTPVSIRDCIFDGTTFSTGTDYYINDTVLTDIDYNAFLSTASRLYPTGAHDVVVSSYNWQIGHLGQFYIPTNSALINTGSQTADGAMLYHFTITTNQVKEAASQVDIGYHYVALHENGSPLDFDADGIPDYEEDANGNGIADGNESSWLINAFNGLDGTSGLKVFTPLK
jgi:hypothetical protein